MSSVACSSTSWFSKMGKERIVFLSFVRGNRKIGIRAYPGASQEILLCVCGHVCVKAPDWFGCALGSG